MKQTNKKNFFNPREKHHDHADKSKNKNVFFNPMAKYKRGEV